LDLANEEQSQVALVLDHQFYRMSSAGVPLWDLEGARDARPASWAEWLEYWSKRAGGYVSIAELAAADNDVTTASAHFTAASLCFHFGQMMVYDDVEAKTEAHSKGSAAYAKAIPLFCFPTERQDVTVDALGFSVPIVRRRPDGDGNKPVVILVAGLEGTKEEMHAWTGFFLDRGIATVTFDGPGQGELSHVELNPETYLAAVESIVKSLENDLDVDSNRIGILGVSMGGLLASMVTARISKIAAAGEIGGTFDTESRWERANALSKRGHQFVCHSDTEAETLQKIRSLSMTGLAEKIKCPFLIVHGELDRIVPIDQATMYRDAIKQAELVIVPQGNHVCHNLSSVSRPMVADWFVHRLR
jgi:pimeloyl-ACP methyl ester carboxylesterase